MQIDQYILCCRLAVFVYRVNHVVPFTEKCYSKLNVADGIPCLTVVVPCSLVNVLCIFWQVMSLHES